MKSGTFNVRTSSREQIIVVTRQVEAALAEIDVEHGFCLVFTPHTTAALAINENADPDVPADLIRGLKAMVPAVHFDHGEGNSDAHLLSALIGPSVLLPLRGGRLLLGRWQGIYFVELDGPRTREVSVHVVAS